MKMIMNEETIKRTIKRLSYQIIETNNSLENVVLFGIKTRGATLSSRVSKEIKDITGKSVPIYELETITYRDDYGGEIKNQITLQISLKGKTVILVDDVLYTGRTIRAALDAVIDIDRPDQIKVAVLVDRGHRELPIKADYVGKNIPTSIEEKVKVKFMENDNEEKVIVI